jgi:hypothetical protein
VNFHDERDNLTLLRPTLAGELIDFHKLADRPNAVWSLLLDRDQAVVSRSSSEAIAQDEREDWLWLLTAAWS